MIYSMTGFGKATGQYGAKTYHIEIRSLNSKGVDISTRLYSAYRAHELEMRKSLSKNLLRGKIDMSISVEENEKTQEKTLNIDVVKGYMEQLKSVGIDIDDMQFLKMAIQMPHVFEQEKENRDIDEAEVKVIFDVLEDAISDLKVFRKSEGKSLEKEIKSSIACISDFLKDVEIVDIERQKLIRTRLKKSVEELKIRVGIDENRFEQELIFYLEKQDITEEKVRLATHLSYFIETMGVDAPNGKKLGFICQEIGREINTIGSKSNHVELQKIVVQMKDELEKIKEQLLNIL